VLSKINIIKSCPVQTGTVAILFNYVPFYIS